MQINRRITNGLAWAGLFVVVAVPVADAISAQLMGDGEQIAVASVAEVEPPMPAPSSRRPAAPIATVVMETVVAEPAKPVVAPSVKLVVAQAVKPAASANLIVDGYLSSGKALPSYITGGDIGAPAEVAVAPTPKAPAAVKPAAPLAAAPVVNPPLQTAVVPVEAAAPVVPAATDPMTVATLTPSKMAPMPMPLSMRPTPVTQPLARQQAEDIFLPPEVVAGNDRPVVVDDLRDWESGPLSDFLAERQGEQSSAQMEYDNDGFFLNEGPNTRRRQRDVYVGPVEDDAYFPFLN
ncbi:hypothetical protein [uncultured Devosia sp.]|uniref:hypothetical protein n=1 Tax=uncultured Devosia sp. TaxID=211434 RepID=UPI0035CB7BEB